MTSQRMECKPNLFTRIQCVESTDIKKEKQMGSLRWLHIDISIVPETTVDQSIAAAKLTDL